MLDQFSAHIDTAYNHDCGLDVDRLAQDPDPQRLQAAILEVLNQAERRYRPSPGQQRQVVDLGEVAVARDQRQVVLDGKGGNPKVVLRDWPSF